MGRRRVVDVAAQLQVLYDQVPTVDCIGRCADACTEFPVPRVERRRVSRAGYDFPVDPVPASSKEPRRICPALTRDGRCAVYDLRPLICRLWGSWQAMPCNYGCRPAAGLLPIKAGYRLLAQAYEISGQPGMAAQLRAVENVPDAKADALALVQKIAQGLLTADQAATLAGPALRRAGLA